MGPVRLSGGTKFMADLPFMRRSVVGTDLERGLNVQRNSSPESNGQKRERNLK